MTHISTPSFHSIPVTNRPFIAMTSWNDEDVESGSSEVDEYGDAWIVDGCRSQRVNSPVLDISTSDMVASPPISTQPIPSNTLTSDFVDNESFGTIEMTKIFYEGGGPKRNKHIFNSEPNTCDHTLGRRTQYQTKFTRGETCILELQTGKKDGGFYQYWPTHPSQITRIDNIVTIKCISYTTRTFDPTKPNKATRKMASTWSDKPTNHDLIMDCETYERFITYLHNNF